MADKSPLDRLYRSNLWLIGVVTVVIGFCLMELAHLGHVPSWLTWLPVTDVGTLLFGSGLVAIYFEYLLRAISEERTQKQIAETIWGSFDAEPARLQSLAGSPMGERIAVNALAAELGDAEIGRAVFDDAKAQVTAAPESWRNVEVSVDFARWTGGPATGRGAMFAVTLRCEYHVRPTQKIMRFSCTSDTLAYDASGSDPANVSTWFIDPSLPVDVASPDTFTVAAVSVNREKLSIDRTHGADSQTYSVVLPDSALSGEEVALSYAYRVLVRQREPLLRLDIPRPTRGFKATFTYDHAGIDEIEIAASLGTTVPARIEHTPPTVPERASTVSFDGWIFPRASVTVGWNLDDQHA